MTNTELNKQQRFINRILNEEAKLSSGNTTYKNLISSLRQLVETTSSVYKKNGDMTAESYQKLHKNYSDVLKNCEEHLQHGKSSFDRSRNVVVAELKNILGKDMHVLNDMDKANPGNLKTAIKNARSAKVYVPVSSKTTTVGGALNSRIPIKNGDKKGFFTETVRFDPKKKWEKLFEDIAKEKCGYDKNIRKILTDPELYNKFERICPLPRRNYKVQDLINIAYLLGIGKTKNEAADIIAENKALYRSLNMLVQTGSPILNETRLMESAGIEEGCRIDSRNAAMSSVATIMGCGNLIAKSVPMVVTNGTETKYGTYMESAEGDDIERLPPDSLLYKCKATSFSNPEVMMQLADIQALDFICGNIDRDIQNMFYKFRDGDPVQLVGIQGIDNDCSFGNRDFTDKHGAQVLIKPASMKYLNKRTAEIILSMDKSMLDAALVNHDLTREEIDAAWERTRQLQEAIKSEKIMLLSNEKEWQTVIDNNQLPENHLFNIMRKMPLEVHNEILKKEQGYTRSAVQYVNSEDMNNAQKFQIRYENIADKSRRMLRLDGGFGSAEFKAMRDSLLALENKAKEIYENMDKQAGPTEQQLNDLETLQNTAIEATENYIDLKKFPRPSTKRGQNKLDLAKDLSSMLMDEKDALSLNENEQVIEEDLQV